MQSPKPFAVFDIDGTLIRWQLLHAVVHSLGKHGYIPADAHQRIVAARMAWKRRTTAAGFAAYEDVLVHEYAQTLQHIDPKQYMVVVDDVFEEYKDQTFTYTRDLVRKLKSEGYVLLAISGSQHEIVSKLAAYYGFDAAVGCTLEQINGAFSGNFDTPVFDKAAALNKLIHEHNLTTKDSYAVGDSMSDAPMLAAVDNPIAFNPDKRLFAEASKHQWRIVLERKNMTYELTPTNGAYVLAA